MIGQKKFLHRQMTAQTALCTDRHDVIMPNFSCGNTGPLISARKVSLLVKIRSHDGKFFIIVDPNMVELRRILLRTLDLPLVNNRTPDFGVRSAHCTVRTF